MFENRNNTLSSKDKSSVGNLLLESKKRNHSNKKSVEEEENLKITTEDNNLEPTFKKKIKSDSPSLSESLQSELVHLDSSINSASGCLIPGLSSFSDEFFNSYFEDREYNQSNTFFNQITMRF